MAPLLFFPEGHVVQLLIKVIYLIELIMGKEKKRTIVGAGFLCHNDPLSEKTKCPFLPTISYLHLHPLRLYTGHKHIYQEETPLSSNFVRYSLLY